MISDFRLQVFQKVAKLRSFTKAARELEISQPAVSKHIAELENTIGDTLFLRNGTDISLTEKGKILLDYTDRILHLYDCVNKELVPKPHLRFDELRIAACPLCYGYFLPTLIDTFRKLYPAVNIILIERQNELIEQMVKDDEVDLGISELNTDSHLLNSTLFASLNLFEGSPIIRLYALFRGNTPKKEIINQFLLTCKTIR